MKRKVLIVIILVGMISFVGCSNNMVEKSIEKAKISIQAKDYDKAIVSLEMALEEDEENSEANIMYQIVSGYREAKKDIQENKFKEANRILMLLNQEYLNYSIKDDIDKLKQQVNKQLKNEEKENVTINESKVDTNKQFKGTKEKYLKKLDSLESELEGINYYNDDAYTTPQMVEAQGKVLKRWDDLLNEIYSLLKVQLSKSEMNDLENKEVNWIKYRDMTADNAAAVYEGGSFARVERVAVLANLTKERCYELVNIYMK